MNAGTAAVPCPQCGTALPADAPEGLCPRCLLALNLSRPTEDPAGEFAGPAGTVRHPPLPPTPPAEIAKFFPQLQILECLGRGGMGVVYKARQPRLNRLVALKVLAPGRERDPQFAERFAREAQALARLAHPAIVGVHDFGEANGLFYLLMEYVDGVSLRTLLLEGKMPPTTALTIIPGICEALQFAHDQGVVHRDIKPENILIDRHGRVKIADFGIAKLIGPPDPSDSPPLTEARGIVGTPHYMAPEQVEHPMSVDHRADIYSLGVVFYELLTGELPLGKFAPPSRRVPIDQRLDAVVLRSLEKEPDRRFQQAGDVKTELEAIASTPRPRPETPGPIPAPGMSPQPVPETLLQSAALTSNRRQVRAAGTVLLLVAVANLLATFLLITAAVVLVLLDRNGVDTDGPLPELAAFLQNPDPSGLRSGIQAALLLVLVGSGVTALGARRMRRFESYRLALVSSAFAMVTPLGNVLGFPLGLWALSVLGRRITQTAFRDQLSASPIPAHRQSPLSRALPWIGVVGIPVLTVLSVRTWMDRSPAGLTRQAHALEAIRHSRDRAEEAKVAAQNAQRKAVTAPSETILALASSVPPVVVATVPVSGAADVDSSLPDIRVTFSKPMTDKSWSWTTWTPESYPESTDDPHYLPDARTCVLPVRLEKGRTYAIWLNSSKFQNFKDSDGRPAVPYLLIFRTREEPAP